MVGLYSGADYDPAMGTGGNPLSQTVAGLGGDLDGALGELPVAAALADREGIIRWQNARFVEVAGDCIGRPLAERVAPESTHEQRRQFSRKVLGTVRTTDYRLNIIAADGSHQPIEVSAVVVEGSDHRIVGVFGTMHLIAPPFTAPSLPLGLTPRQLEVLHHLTHGESTAQIADRLGIQRETVRNHVRGILRALGVHSRLEAVAAARQRGLLAD
jgi:DNA-binding CsgD family transcriptional regulator